MDLNISRIKVSLFGACGRMGFETALMLSKESGFELVNIFERPDHPSIGSMIYGLKLSGDPYSRDLKDTVFCDFTNHKAALKHASLAAEIGSPILIGATGFSAEDLIYLEKLGEKIPLMVAPNLSRGIDLLYRLAESAAKKLRGDFGVEIVEAHHQWKKDMPSGTAIRLAEIIRETGEHEEIPTHSLRIGDLTGEHCVIFAGEGETIEITHRASSRKAFAKGVPIAIKFLARTANGFYSFKDALNA